MCTDIRPIFMPFCPRDVEFSAILAQNKCGAFMVASSKPRPLEKISWGWNVSREFAVGHGARFTVAQGYPRGPRIVS